MAGHCSRRNPLTRSGTTQHARLRPELAAGYFLPDERDGADLILFGQRLARVIRYYDHSNGSTDDLRDWSAFFDGDLTARLAALAKLPVGLFRDTQADLERWLKADSKRAPDRLASHARLLFHLPFALLQQAARQYHGLPPEHALRSRLVELVSHELNLPLRTLAAWYKGAFDPALGAGNQVFDDRALDKSDYRLDSAGANELPYLPLPLQAALDWQQPLSAASLPTELFAGLHAGGWPALYAAVEAESAPYVDAIGHPQQRYEQIFDALSDNLLVGAIGQLYAGLERIRREAGSQLEDSLRNDAGHAPQHGLWLAFLALFRYPLDELNQFSARHRDFYFREVLRLQPRPAQANQVHVLFGLASGHEAHLLRAGTLLRAGKDALGKPLSYALDDDLVVNRARVAALHSLQLRRGGSTAQPSVLALASLEPNSATTESADAAAGWPAFGSPQSPPARIGFAIADRKLFLREGERTIRLQIELERALPATTPLPRWIVRLSGAEGWITLDGDRRVSSRLIASTSSTTEPIAASAIVLRPGAVGPMTQLGPLRPDALLQPGRSPLVRKWPLILRRKLLEITIQLRASDPPIVPVQSAVHGVEHAAGLPTAEFIVDFSAAESPPAFAQLRDVLARDVNLRVEASGLKQLTVVAGDAIVDSASAFAPFGLRPRAGAQWIIGSSEIFSKTIEHWSLKVDWAQPYDEDSHFWNFRAADYDADEAVLSEGKWHPARRMSRRWQRSRASLAEPAELHIAVAARRSSGGTALGLGETDTEIVMQGAGLIDGRSAQTLENPELSAASVTGFVRLRLPRDFGHQAFIGENTRALIELAKGSAGYHPGPKVNKNPNTGLPCEPYDALITRLEARYRTTTDPVASFSLLYPFGVLARPEAGGRLFPALPFQGELLIGIEHFVPPARLSLLVQVVDGSADPLRPAPTLQFHYLQDDNWRAFDPQDVDDRTGGFSSSGVLGLKLPAAASPARRLLPAGLHWIRIATAGDASSLNRLLSIDAQAARASYLDQANDPNFLAAPLPAASITRLVEPQSAIARISQPYPSFGGRMAENEPAFAARISERLRHKDRASTLWDYENLVLEAFPQLYRVKCLSTTRLIRDPQGTVIADNELLPGAVTVVTVPWTHGRSSHDPLRPYTDQATLAAVDQFLRERISPFVHLEVQNPQFEEVQADFKVKFRPQARDSAFQLQQLNEALIDFLTPWARNGGEITFGGSLWKSAVIGFVEARAEVDYVTDFRLYHHLAGTPDAGAPARLDVEQVQASSARSILVSARRHLIVEVDADV